MKVRLDGLVALLAVAAVAVAAWQLHAAGAAVRVERVSIGGTPARIYRPPAGDGGPVVVIAHGFAGSQVLMQTFAVTFAQNGYIAVTFDFPGHGMNREPLTGSITEESGATQVLASATRRVLDYARPLGDGRLAILGHSMASDIVIRVAETTPGVAATIAVSMFSPAVTAVAPRNLLVIVGDWEPLLKREALRAVGLATAPAAAVAGTTYGDPRKGTARRVAISPRVEHVSVLFSECSMREAVRWLDRSFGIARNRPVVLHARGPWLMLLLTGSVLLAWPLSRLLPRLAEPPAGAGRRGRGLWISLLVPAVATPLVLRVLPTHFLPILVGDYLALHFALYGMLTAVCTRATRVVTSAAPPVATRPLALRRGLAFYGTTLAVLAFGFAGLVWPINSYFTVFVPGPQRVVLILVMLAGTLAFFLSDEWLTRGATAARGAYAVSKILFLVSLAIAVALDPYRLFFLIIIVPVIVLFFLVYGLFSTWLYRRTGDPWVGGVANAVAFAWAIGCTFPLLSG